MKKTQLNFRCKFVALLLIISAFSGYSQMTSSENFILTTVIKKQANEMGNAFIIADYKSFVKFTHPTLIQLMGGENKMITTLTKTINDAKSQGVSFLSIAFDNPTKIIENKNELQCTIKQHLTAQVTNGKVTNSSILIAVSLNNGKKWFFIDTTNKNITQMRQLLPNLSSEIVIPNKI